MKNWLSKAFAEQTIRNFQKKFGIDLRAALKEEMDKGADFVEAYANVVNRATGGDTQLAQQIMPDQEANRALVSLMSSQDRYRHFRDAVDAPENKNVAMDNLNAMIDLQATKLTKLSNQWENFFTTLGGNVSGPIGKALDAAADQISAPEAFEVGLKARGYSGLSGQAAQFLMLPSTQKEIIAEGRLILEGKSAQPFNAPGGDSMVARKEPLANGGRPIIPGGELFATNGATTPATDNRMSAIASMLSGMDARLAEITGQAPLDAHISDNRVDSRNQSVTVNSSVVQNISQPSSAPGAVGDATNAAVAGAVTPQAARLQQEPAF